MVRSYKRFDQFQEPLIAKQWDFLIKTRSALATNSFSNFQRHSQQVANKMSAPWPYTSYSIQPLKVVYPQQFHMLSRAMGHASYTRMKNSKETLWGEFKRIYITEVIAFTMNKSTLFTLIFSFMFLGCIFFLSGFFAATSIYKGREEVKEVHAQHMPTQTADLQGRPEKMVDMGAGLTYATPQAYQSQGGVKVDQNRRRPSAYVERQITAGQLNYR